MDDRYLRSSATAISVGHRREMDDGLLPMVHDKCGSSSVANTTATEPFAWQWEGHHMSLPLSLSSFPGGGGGSVRFVGAVSVV